MTPADAPGVFLRPDWPAPAQVQALMSTRRGGVSQAPFDSLNLRPSQLGGDAMDDRVSIAENQRRFAQALGADPVWLNQVHGARVLRLRVKEPATDQTLPQADASVSTVPGLACAVLVADCLPVLLCSRDGRVVGAAHAGWRGLAGGVLEATVAAMGEASGTAPGELLAWLGPCIGAQAFEVGADVLSAFGATPAQPGARFIAQARPDGSPRWRADLVGLARDRLAHIGVDHVSGGAGCTVTEPLRFFSFRRDGRCGRMAAAIAIGG